MGETSEEERGMTWISVKDKLPVCGVRVLVYSDREELMPEVEIGILYGYPTLRYWTWSCYRAEGVKSLKFEEIEYWQPCPGPPASEPSRMEDFIITAQ